MSSDNANQPKPTNVKMNPRFSFSGSTSKGFKKGVNRRGSSCTALTEVSPATTSDEYDGSSDSFESGSSGSYEESSSDYDDSGSGSEYSDLMNELPINNTMRGQAPGPYSTAQPIQSFALVPTPLHGVVEESEGDVTPAEEEYHSAKETLSDFNGSSSCYGELVSPIATTRQGPARTVLSSPSVVPAHPEELMSSTYADGLCRDASMQVGPGGGDSRVENKETDDISLMQEDSDESSSEMDSSDEDSDEYGSSSDGSESGSEEAENSSTGYSDLMGDLPIKLTRQVKESRQQLKRKDANCIAPSASSNSLQRMAAAPPEAMEEDFGSSVEGEDSDSEEGSSSYDSDESSGSEYSSGEDMDTEDNSSDWSSSEDSSFDNLMHEMPIARGRTGPPVSPRRANKAPVLAAPTVPIPSTEIPCQDPPMEGLAMLQNIRAELQKVGQMIVKNKDGEKFLQRAQILASINYLASNVPRCVLEDLGQEIRDQLKSQAEKKNRKQKSKNVMNSLLRISVDDASVASDISHHEDHNTFAGDKSFADSIETASDDEEEDDFFPESTTPETVRRKYTLENFVPMKTPMGIRESRLSLNSTLDATGSVLAPKLRKGSGPERRGASRTYSFSSCSSTSESTDDWDERSLPILTYFECALLFVDISGFTKLSTLLDPENLSKVINTYFELLVSHVSDFNGDIQKFAGDALFAEFRATPSCPLSKCCELAAACAASLVRDCSDFPVSTICGLMDTDAEGIPASLNVHCGLGIGEMAGLHIGDNENRREYLYLGNPIKQTAEACDFAQLGEAAASREFCQHLQQMGVFQPDLSADEQSAFVIAERAHSFLKCNEAELLASQRVNARSRGITEHVEGLEPESLKEYRRLMSLYVHPVAVSNDVAAENDFSPTSRRKEKNSRDRQLEEAELRSVYTMFVNPKVSVEMTGDVAHDTASVEIVHEIMKIANRELRKYNGHMRQFVMDDKGMVFIATFGLRGSTFPNMVGERALPATIAMYNALHYELGIEVKIGATFGDAYCGAVGGEKRHEYAVMGPSVNLAARLMANKSNPGILVDKAVRKLASQSFAFNALPAIKAKGYKELVQIFEPLSPVERGWGQILPYFVGRIEQMQKIAHIASEFHRRQNSNSQMVIVRSSTGMGKSTLIAHSIDKVKKLFISKKARVGIARHVGRESESLKPFLVAANLLRIMLSHYRGCFDDAKSLASGKDSCYSSMAGSLSGDNASYSGDSTVLSMSQFADRLEAVFIEVGAPNVHLEYVKSLLLEDHVKQDELLPELDGGMVSTLATAFKRINNSLRLSILAIDDAHHCDEASWLVFEEIFLFSANTLFLTTTSGASLADSKINKSFLAELHDRYTNENRCHSLSLENLSRDEVKHMIMKTLALQEHEVTDHILDSVYSQSLGMPLVASGLVEKLKQTEQNESKFIDFGGSGSVADIFLHKIDGFDTTVRDALNVCALLGSNFSFDDIFAVLSGMSDGKAENIRKECESSVKNLVNEGILSEYSGEYMFSHDLWRTIPLGLMLASRKRDIHRKVAHNMEKKISHLDVDEVPLQMHEKIFEHWKATGDTTKPTEAALVLRRRLEKEGNFAKCVSIFEDVLSLWGWKSESNEARLAGLSKAFLHHVAAEELSLIIKMLVGLGRAYAESSRPNIGVIWWENALRVMNSTKSAPLIRDISIVFPAFDGISKAIQDGHMVQDVYCRYEQAMIRKFIQETRAHGRLIHHIHALFLQMKLYGRQGNLDKGIAVYSIIKSIYKPEKHSEKLRLAYGQDSGALSQALCAFWETIEGEKKNGLKMCRSVLKDLLPRFDRDFLNMFNLMYPLAMAFKEAGHPNEARGFFTKLVIAPFEGCPEDHPLRHLVQVFPVISILFGVSNSKKVSRSEIREWAIWVVQQHPFGRKLQLELGRFGRCANSLLAEICLLLADKIHMTDPLRAQVLEKGNELAAEALHFHRKFGMVCAIKPTKSIMNRLRRASKSS